MTPGPKKRSTNKKSRQGKQGSENVINSELLSKNSECQLNATELSPILDDTSSKYSKRTIQSNWEKYNEPVLDKYGDTKCGEDYETAISSSGGFASVLQLQDETYWDETSDQEKCIAIDFNDIAFALKCIPVTKRLNLPSDIFDSDQLSKFESAANYNKKIYSSKFEQNVQSQKLNEVNLTTDISVSIEDDDDIIVKPCKIKEATENIIESLTSCLSLKSKAKEVAENTVSPEASKPVDDLDFLLSLSIPSKTPTQEQKGGTDTNVDDWLNSILDN